MRFRPSAKSRWREARHGGTGIVAGRPGAIVFYFFVRSLLAVRDEPDSFAALELESTEVTALLEGLQRYQGHDEKNGS